MDIRKRITNSKVYNTLLLLGGGIGIGLWIYNFILYNDFFFNSYESLISSFIGLSCALAIKAFEIVLNKHVPWNRSVPFRLLIAVLTSILISLIVISLIMGIYLYFIGVLDDSFSMEQEVLLNLIALITFVSIIYNIINFAFHSYNTYSKGQVDKIKLERKRISLQLKALKDQLSPHFLFNSLNTISSLIYKDDEVAEQFIRNLAEAYKYTLKSYDKRLVSLKDELHFVKAYQDLLVTRFQDALQVTIDVESHLLETAIPPLTIQLLVENATKHNIINADMPLHLEVANENKYLVISNNKTKCPENVRSFKIGLKNIDRRYELLTGQNIQVINATSDFCVKLPNNSKRMKSLLIHNNIVRLSVPFVSGILAYVLVLMFNNDLISITEYFVGTELYFCIAVSYLMHENSRFLLLLFENNNWIKTAWLNIACQFLAVVVIGLLLSTLSY